MLAIYIFEERQKLLENVNPVHRRLYWRGTNRDNKHFKIFHLFHFFMLSIIPFCCLFVCVCVFTSNISPEILQTISMHILRNIWTNIFPGDI